MKDDTYYEIEDLVDSIEIFRTKSKLWFIPARATCREIIKSAFSVSCLEEEDRKLSFRICVIDLNKEEFKPLYGVKVFKFSTKIPFNNSNLKKIALSANPNRTIICVSPKNKNKKMTINGLLFLFSNYAELSEGSALWGSVFPDIFNILVRNPGTLSFCVGEKELVCFNTGKITINRCNLFEETGFKNLISIGQSIILGNERLKDITSPDIPVFRNFIKMLISNINDIKHGGSVLIIPDFHAIKDSLNIKYPIEDDEYITRLLVDELSLISYYMENHDKYSERLSILLSKIKQISLTIADFTAVDGALVLGQDGKIIGYGAEILIDDPDDFYVYFVDASGFNVSKKIREYGTRHRSVFRMIKQYPGVYGFIFSQDGGVKACINDNGKVLVYTDIQNDYDRKNSGEEYIQIIEEYGQRKKI